MELHRPPEDEHDRRPHAFGQSLLLLQHEDFVDELIQRAKAASAAEFVANLNMRALGLLRSDPEFAAAYERASVCHVDGAPLVPMLRASGIAARMSHRQTFVDFMPALLERSAAEQLSVAFVGGAPDRVEPLLATLRRRHSGLELFAHHGYFGIDDSEAVIEALLRFEPRVIVVGMGMPLQERWIASVLERLPPSIVLNGGGIIDLLSGDRWIPPRWTGRLGVEALARLVRYPSSWRRYMVEPWPVVPFALREMVAIRRSRRLPL